MPLSRVDRTSRREWVAETADTDGGNLAQDTVGGREGEKNDTTPTTL